MIFRPKVLKNSFLTKKSAGSALFEGQYGVLSGSSSPYSQNLEGKSPPDTLRFLMFLEVFSGQFWLVLGVQRGLEKRLEVIGCI